jgi:multiple sugar transport system substrate-binding protein
MSDNSVPEQSVSEHGRSSLTLNRRALLKGFAGGVGVAALAPMLAACGSDSSPGTGGGGASDAAGPVTFGSNYSDAAPKAAFAALMAATTQATGTQITVNTVDHNTFQQNISSYLQGTPDDLFTWFAGYRMQFFAAQDLATPLDDVWEKIGGNFNEATKSLSKGLDGKYYFVPVYNYPWVVFYNKSTFAKNGYTVPTSWDDFIALVKKMKTDGLIPLAFADKDGWPALGTFDILNLRINGYDYHIKLMKHEVPWTDGGVTNVFKQWAELLPYCQTGANGRIWQDAAKTLENKQAGMMFQGSNQVAANYAPKNLADLDFFPFPVIEAAHGQDYMDAPTDGFMLSKKAKRPTAAKKVLEYLGTGAAEATYLKTDAWDVALAQGLTVPTYNAIQTKSVQAISSCKAVSQFMDRDTDPAMATAMIGLIQKFIDDPSTSNISTIQQSAENQAKTIFN